MKIKAQILHLSVFAQHIKAGLFCQSNVKYKGFVGGSSHKPVRPVALIQDPIQKKRLMVQAKDRDAGFILFYSYAAHGKIAADFILSVKKAHRIQIGSIRCPEL